MKAVAAGLLLAMLGLGWLLAGPFLTMRGIDQGARARDPEQLDRHIDFPELRRNLKRQLQGAIEEKLERKARDKPWAALGLAFSDDAAERVVDSLVTPEGIARLLEGRDWQKRQKKKKRRARDRIEGKTTRAGADERAERDWSFHSAGEFDMRVTREGKTTQFILTRKGLGWELTNILLPAR